MRQYPNLMYYTAETECMGIEYDGSVTLRAWGVGRNKKDAVEQAKKKAIRDVLFITVRNGSTACNPRPLVPEVNAEMKYEDYFNHFFSDKNGEYKSYCIGKYERISNKMIRKGMSSSRQVTYSVIVRVKRSELRVKLKEDGIIE